MNTEQKSNINSLSPEYVRDNIVNLLQGDFFPYGCKTDVGALKERAAQSVLRPLIDKDYFLEGIETGPRLRIYTAPPEAYFSDTLEASFILNSQLAVGRGPKKNEVVEFFEKILLGDRNITDVFRIGVCGSDFFDYTADNKHYNDADGYDYYVKKIGETEQKVENFSHFPGEVSTKRVRPASTQFFTSCDIIISKTKNQEIIKEKLLRVYTLNNIEDGCEYELYDAGAKSFCDIYDRFFTDNRAIYFHCRAGIGRSCQAAFTLLLLKCWDKIFVEAAGTTAQNIRNLIDEIRKTRPLFLYEYANIASAISNACAIRQQQLYLKETNNCSGSSAKLPHVEKKNWPSLWNTTTSQLPQNQTAVSSLLCELSSNLSNLVLMDSTIR